MADSKITALTSIGTSTDPVLDQMVIVDVSDGSMAATGTTKKVSLNQLLSSNPSATGGLTLSGALAAGSATITGDLTVDTNTFYVKSSTNQVGIGTTSPNANFTLDLTSSNDARARQWFADVALVGTGDLSTGFQIRTLGTGTNGLKIANAGNTVEWLRIDSNGVHTWQNVGGVAGTAMTLNSTGLGVGVTPSGWNTVKPIQVGYGSIYGLSASELGIQHNAYYASGWKYIANGLAAQLQLDGTIFKFQAATNNTSGAGASLTWTTPMTLDASGNLLVGKTATDYLTVGCEIKPLGAFNCTQSGSTNANTAWDTYSTGASAYRFYVGMAGTVFATNTTISAISDARFKENVQDIDVGLGAILALKPRKFDWKAGKGKDIKGDRGFIAQEFEQVFPQLVDEWRDNAPEGEAPYKSVRQDLIPVLVKAIQELTARVQTLEAK